MVAIMEYIKEVKIKSKGIWLGVSGYVVTYRKRHMRRDLSRFNDIFKVIIGCDTYEKEVDMTYLADNEVLGCFSDSANLPSKKFMRLFMICWTKEEMLLHDNSKLLLLDEICLDDKLRSELRSYINETDSSGFKYKFRGSGNDDNVFAEYCYSESGNILEDTNVDDMMGLGFRLAYYIVNHNLPFRELTRDIMPVWRYALSFGSYRLDGTYLMIPLPSYKVFRINEKCRTIIAKHALINGR